MKGEGEHIWPHLRHTLAFSDRERLQFMDRPTLVKYDAGDEILAELERLFQAPKRPRMGNLLIAGDSNNGKTTLVAKFQQEHGKPFIEARGRGRQADHHGGRASHSRREIPPHDDPR